MTRVVIGDFRTGQRLLDLPYTGCSWSKRRNTAEQLSATVPLTDPDVQLLDLRAASAPLKAFIAIVEGDTIMGAGPIWRRVYHRDAGTLELDGAGIWSWANRRTISRTAARTIDTSQFVVPDPANPGKTKPNPDLGYAPTGLSLGTLAKRVMQQIESWVGGGVPLVYLDDVAGTHQRTFQGVDFKSAGEALTDLTNVDGGPDIEFTPRWRADRLGIEWVLRTGTDDEPYLSSESLHIWDLSVPEPSMRGLSVEEDGTQLASVAWVTGGRSDDNVLVERAISTDLTDAGYALTEAVDTSHTSVSQRTTLALYATEIIRRNAAPSELWGFQVRKDQKPLIGEYGLGDRCLLKIRDDPYIPDGDYVRTIASMSGDEGDWVTIQTDEVFSG